MKTNFIKTLFVTLFLLSVNIVNAHDFEVDGIYYNITDATNKTVAVTYEGYYYDSDYNRYTGSVVIPESVRYNGKVYSVTSIGNYAFVGCSGLTSIKIPNSVTSIGEWAFRSCSGLTSITIPNSVTSIGYRAFYDCYGLKSVTIGNGVTSIEDCAFYGTAWYNNQPDGVVYAGNVLYKYKGTMPSNTSVVVKDGTLGIAGGAFSGCSGLTSITIPNSVTSIGDEAFNDCRWLTSIVIPNSVTSIGDEAFNGTAWYNNQPDGVVYAGNVLYKYKGTMPSNTSVVVKEGTLSIGEDAFYNCSGLTSITIPNSVTSIGNYAFSYCYGLTSIEIPNSVTSIGNEAFYGCSGFTSIEIPNGVTSIGGSAFAGCSGLTSIVIPNGVTSIGYRAFADCSGLKSVTIGNSVTRIGESAFKGCSGLASIIIGNSVTNIGNYAFYNCRNLKTVTNYSKLIFSAGSSDYGYIAYYADKVINYPNCSIIGDFVFSTVGGKHTLVAYMGNTTEITLPDNYNGENYVIGEDAFYNCSGLTSVTIPNSVTRIGESAFKGCSGLASIIIGNSVTNIGNSAFYDCSNLETVINLSNLTFSKGSSDYGYVAYYANKVINTHDDDVVGDFVFSTVDDKHTLVAYFGDATDVTLPGNYNGENYVIGNDAFKGCSGLASIIIGNSVTSIGDYAFEDCTGLTSIVIPNSVTSIGSSAFSNCTGITSITIPNSVTSIGNGAFYDCSGLASIEIPNSITSIGNQAFENCTGLKTVYNFSNLTFGKGVNTNGYVAYYADKVYNAPNGSIEGDFIFGKPNDVNTLLYYLGNTVNLILPTDYKGENYVIDSAVFKDNTVITSVTIPNSVTSVGDDAFTGCTNVEKLYLDCAEVSDWFSGVSAMKEVTIGNGVTSVVASAFNGCTGLEKVCINDLAAWCGIDFGSTDANPLYYAKKLYLNGKLLTDISIPTEVEKVKDYAFYNCNGVTIIDIVDGVKSIGSNAFYGCSNLETLYISNTIESIGDYAFAECNNIFDIKIGSKKAITASENIFSSDAYNNACLYVPNGRKDFYAKTSPWSNFIIREMDFTGIEDVEAEGERVKDVYFDLSGRVVENPTNGVYIINGKKVVIK